ncbi:MAG: hypothetical protein GWP10_03335, partial [Nitrospiraceae bacterium]|nr:hypothetical protein [Nitrospiraceae bacterium]
MREVIGQKIDVGAKEFSPLIICENRNFSINPLLNDPAEQGPRLKSSKTRAISESKEKKGIYVLSQGEKT